MLRAAAVAAVAVTALIGGMHLPGPRAWLAAEVGCPIPVGAPDLATADAWRARALAPLAGEGVVAADAPLGIVLGNSTAAELVAAAAAVGGSCAAPHTGALRCVGVVVDGGSSEVAADIDARDRVVALSVVARPGDEAAARAAFAAAVSAVPEALGSPDADVGEDAPGWLAGRLARQRRQEWRAANLRVQVSVTHLGDGRFVLSQVHQAIPNG